MITGKKTLEVAGPRQRADERAPYEKEFYDDAFCRDDKVCPLDDLEFGEIGLEANPIESQENQKRLTPKKQVDKKVQLRLSKNCMTCRTNTTLCWDWSWPVL